MGTKDFQSHKKWMRKLSQFCVQVHINNDPLQCSLRLHGGPKVAYQVRIVQRTQILIPCWVTCHLPHHTAVCCAFFRSRTADELARLLHQRLVSMRCEASQGTPPSKVSGKSTTPRKTAASHVDIELPSYSRPVWWYLDISASGDRRCWRQSTLAVVAPSRAPVDTSS